MIVDVPVSERKNGKRARLVFLTLMGLSQDYKIHHPL